MGVPLAIDGRKKKNYSTTPRFKRARFKPPKIETKNIFIIRNFTISEMQSIENTFDTDF